MLRPIEAADVTPYTKVRNKRTKQQRIIDGYEPASQMVKLGFAGRICWEYEYATIADLMSNWEVEE